MPAAKLAKLTEAERKLFLERVSGGVDRPTLARIYGVSLHAVDAFIARGGEHCHSSKDIEAHADKIISLYKYGMSVLDIEGRTKFYSKHILELLRRHGVEIRPIGSRGASKDHK